MGIIYTLRKSCKFSVIAFVIMFVLRLILFFSVHESIKQVDVNHKDNGFGAYWGEFIENTTGSIIFTLLLLILFTIYYFSNFYIIKITNKMEDFIKTQAEENLISQTILINPHELK